MVTDVLVTMVFFIGALLIGAVVMWILTGDDEP
jgi:archaellum component FlaG (FlaF/FlaG flagellin family)